MANRTKPCRLKEKNRNLKNDERIGIVLFLLPSLVGAALFFLLPLLGTVKRSFLNGNGTRFVGFANYDAALKTPAFLLALANTSRFLATCIPILLVASLFVAVLTRLVSKKWSGFFRSTFLLPIAVPTASVALLWSFAFGKTGLANGFILSLGGSPVDFLGSSAAFWVLILAYLWRNCGYNMILWVGGLNDIPQDIYAAASVDGASALQTFLKITLPNLKSTIFLTALLSLINGFKVFREAYLLAGSYPALPIYQLQHLFNHWFDHLQVDTLSAAAVLLAIALAGIIFALAHLLKRSRP